MDVQQAGEYSLQFRYACGNQNGGGPFRIESDGVVAQAGITVGYTGDWNNWASKTVNNVPLKSGQQILRVYFDGGELNLGRMTFTYTGPLPYDQPVAEAGDNVLVILPQATATLDGSNSSDPGGANLSYTWNQVYGPSVLDISNNQIAQPGLSNVEEGVYLMELWVDNGSYTDRDEVYIISND
ncbi:MAG: carbohydrate-binding protein, partial [Bacteroidota bacterium]